MTFYKKLDTIMKQDIGNRGLLPSLPGSPLMQLSQTLKTAKHIIILTGFPVRLENGDFIGETDGPSGAANLASALIETGCQISVVTDFSSYRLLKAALSYRAPMASLFMLPDCGADTFIRSFIAEKKPTHLISLERPGKAADGHYYNMRGESIDDMVTDSALFLSEAKKQGIVTISIGDGGNEMGMGFFKRQIYRFVPSGEKICTEESANLVLASGVSNWWGWGIAALLSHETSCSLLPSDKEETELLKRVVDTGGVDGCTKKQAMTVDNISLETHLGILAEVRSLVQEYENFSPCFKIPYLSTEPAPYAAAYLRQYRR